MSQVLVSPPSIPLLGPMEPLERPPSQQQLRLDAMNLTGDMGTASLEEKSMASQLAYLASQHHASEYNRLKFGPGGAPITYIPLSIQLPAHVRQLKARQAQSAYKKVWWPAAAPKETHSGNHMDVNPSRNHVQDSKSESLQCENVAHVAQCTQAVWVVQPEFDRPAPHLRKRVPPLNHPPTLNLQRELSVAMSSPLSVITIPQLSPQVVFQQPNLNLHAKTSESHPINISPIIPFELLPLITSHLKLTPRHTPYMFELPPSLFLHSLAMHAFSPPPDRMRSYPIVHPPNGSFISSANSTDNLAARPVSSCVSSTRFSNGIPELVARDVNEHDPRSNTAQTPGKGPGITIPGNPSSLGQNRLARKVASSQSSLVFASPRGRPHSAPPLLLSSHAVPPDVLANGVVTIPPPLPELVDAISSDILSKDRDVGDEKAAPSPSIPRAVSPPTICATPGPILHLRSLLGNMLLSSCPGKKVRLSGPVKGRGAICRDLDHDLRRVRALGVGCIICCLDDEELEFLGASWSQYSEIARAVGLDILRMPIPEGLVPPTPALLDQHLSYIIHSYTLKGVPVLVHCRGGVGRAGLVACCWMLKLGLCGWLSRIPEGTNRHVNPDGIAVAKVRKETVELVERVIAVVRRRRSVKAIETYEQVHFLVEFVEHLVEGGSRGDT